MAPAALKVKRQVRAISLRQRRRELELDQHRPSSIADCQPQPALRLRPTNGFALRKESQAMEALRVEEPIDRARPVDRLLPVIEQLAQRLGHAVDSHEDDLDVVMGR